MNRRGFLFACVLTPPGIWLASRGVVSVSSRFVARLAGDCSFCGKSHRETRAIVGIQGCSARICDECVDLCHEIIVENRSAKDAAPQSPGRPPVATRHSATEQLVESFAELGQDLSVEQAQQILGELAPPLRDRSDVLEFHCSFCFRARSEVATLISGPRVFICGDCSFDAAGAIAAIG